MNILLFETNILSGETSDLNFISFANQHKFVGRMYTLVMVRRDIQNSISLQNLINPYPQPGGDGSVFLHWMKINVPGNNLGGGTPVLQYIGKQWRSQGGGV